MVPHEQGAHARRAEQEGLELLGEDVVPRHRVPDLPGHLHFRIGAGRDAPEVAVGEVLDLVVVVEHHVVVAGHAEVLPQHVAGEDVGAGQLADRVTVLDHGVLGLGLAGAVEVDVQRDHALLDVEVLDDHLVVLDLDLRRGHLLQLGEQRRVETVERQRDVRELQRVGHPADAVVLLDQQVLLHDRGAVDLLRRGDHVLDQLEDVRERREHEHVHHHPGDARGDHEVVARVVQVVVEVAVETGLALFLQADHRVEIARRLGRHHAAQEAHVGRRHFHVDQEVGPVEAEQHVDVRLLEQDGVEEEPPRLVLQHRDHERVLVVAVDHLADHVGRLVAVERGGEHLHLVVRLRLGPLAAEIAQHQFAHPPYVAFEVGEGQRPVEIEQDLRERLAHRRVARVVAAVRRRVGLEVLGRRGRAEEDEVVVEVGAVHDPAEDRVEEGLGQFRLLVLVEQADVDQLDLLPRGVVDRLGVELRVELLDDLADTVVVELDAVLDQPVDAVPVGLLEELLGVARTGAEDPVVLVEAAHDLAGDAAGGRVLSGGDQHGRLAGRFARRSIGGPFIPSPGEGEDAMVQVTW